ncbi:unnamed protein product [Pocillopora meandrina]|uniref:G-protein coupled receptors family 1 profile domain-containing protein n=1 Tax=Pocillopora meandrina TaxID=46732 RepID=A0AAU9XTI7_9CNID|nr:unnamed protein product [Pocillopora meandrina]
MPHSHQSLMEVILVFFNSTLNPFLYCWKITKARRAMKQTIRHALCFTSVQEKRNEYRAMSTTEFTSDYIKDLLWVKLAVVVCFAPSFIVVTAIAHSKTHSSHWVTLRGMTVVLIYFKSTLNPFLYCWKIREERQAMKQTIRQALCFPWS